MSAAKNPGPVPSGDDLPVRGSVSREEFDRIIRRASELQSEHLGVGDAPEIGEEELLRIGGEVGLDPRHVRRALGEVRAEGLQPAPPADPGLMARWIGAGFLHASRVVPDAEGLLEERLEAHLSTVESLRRVRKRGGRSLWEPVGSVFTSVRRTLGVGESTYDLARATSLDLSLVPMEEGYRLVTLIVDVRKIRGEAGLAGMIGMGICGSVAGLGLGFAVGFPPLALPLAATGVGLGGRIGRSAFNGHADRIRLSMEGLLDRLEGGDSLESRRPSPWIRRFGR